MANNEGQNLSLSGAAGLFLAGLSAGEKEASQQEVYKFVRWYGWDRPFTGLTAPEIANYAEQLSLSDTDYARKLDLLRDFLVHAKKQGWSKSSLSTHLKAKKGKPRLKASTRQSQTETITLTQQGYAELEAELAALKSKSMEVTEEMRRAAADKDFRENAPLHAARERKGHIEGRIMELEQTFKFAVIVGGKKEANLKAIIGDSVVLSDMASGGEIHYTIVHPTEVDPTKGKISSASPIGKAIVGHCQGEVVEVVVPAGKLRYQINQIKR